MHRGLSGCWQLCHSLAMSPLQPPPPPSLSVLMEMFLVSDSLSLPGDADAQEPASSLRGGGGGGGRSHAGAFVHVSVCSGMHRVYIRDRGSVCVRVCVAWDDSVS